MIFFECSYSIGHGVIGGANLRKGFARRIQPTFPGANMGHPSTFK
jgi:hypothetical protein